MDVREFGKAGDSRGYQQCGDVRKFEGYEF